MVDLKMIKVPNNVGVLTRDTLIDYANDKRLIVPNNINRIVKQAFSCFTRLEEIVLPNTCIEIDNEAFSNCPSLRKINIPDGVKIIKRSTFSSCSSLKDITLPDSIKEIGSNAFASCKELEQIDFPNNLKVINEFAFINCYSLKDVKLPNSLRVIGENAFSNCKRITEINIPSGVDFIGNQAFSNCQELKKVILPTSVSEIEAGAFTHCKKLESVIIPKKVKEITYSMFCECESLEYVDLPKGITSIAGHAFHGCESLKEIQLPKHLKNIDQGAFSSCISLKEIKIPKGVGNISSRLFQDCITLQNIELHDGIKLIEPEAFSGCRAIEDVILPKKLLELGESAFMDCSSLKSIKLPNLIEIIKPYTFAGCNSLKEVLLPEGLFSICAEAFADCTSLHKIVMPQSLIGVELNAFTGCIFNYVYKENGCIVFNRDLPKDLNGIDKIVDLKELSKNVVNFDVGLLATEAGFNKYINAINILRKNKITLSSNIIKQLDYLGMLDQIGKDLNFKHFRNESKAIYDKIYSLNDNEELNYFKFAGLLGCFSNKKLVDKYGQVTEVELAQKANTFFANVVKNNLIGTSQLNQIFNDLPLDFDSNPSQEFLQFITIRNENKNYPNLDLLLNLEDLYPGIFSKIMINFDELKGRKVGLNEQGKPKNLSWKEVFINYYKSNAYKNINSENREIAKVFLDKGLEQEVFDKASILYNDARQMGIRSHILNKPLKEKTIFEEIENIKDFTSSVLDDGKELLDDLYSKKFTYEMLDKHDPYNAIIGLCCSCCATIMDPNYGRHIAAATIKSNEVQNIVIRDGKGEIIAKGTMYVNEDKGYAVINDFELNAKYRKNETYRAGIYADNEDKVGQERELIFKAFMRCVNDFIKVYDAHHPNKPLKQVNVGMGYNRLKLQCERYKIAMKNLEVPLSYNFQDAYSEQRVLYKRSARNNQQEGMDL